MIFSIHPILGETLPHVLTSLTDLRKITDFLNLLLERVMSSKVFMDLNENWESA